VDKKLDYCLNISSPFEIVENVLSNYYDLGIIMISNLQREFWLKMLKNKQMVFIPIEAFDPQVLLGKTHPLAKEDAIEVSLLKEYPHVFYDAIVDGNLNYIAEQKQLGIYESSTKVRANDRSLMFDLIKDLGGYSIGFGNNDEYFDSYGIRCVPIVDVDIHFEIGYIKNESIPLSRISEKFITVLKQAITSGYAP
jgi:DNA-binding transcriptional LysR family regulator